MLRKNSQCQSNVTFDFELPQKIIRLQIGNQNIKGSTKLTHGNT